MYYEINVAKQDLKPNLRGEYQYTHFFATAPRSFTYRKETEEALTIFMEKFPSPEYHISVYVYPENGTYYPSVESFMKDNS
jgi:hypothetical protein